MDKKNGTYNKYETNIDAAKVIVSFLLKEKNGNIDNVNNYLDKNHVKVNPQPVLQVYSDIIDKSRYTSLIDSIHISTQWKAKNLQSDNFFKLVNTVNNDCNLDIHVWTDVQALDIVTK